MIRTIELPTTELYVYPVRCSLIKYILRFGGSVRTSECTRIYDVQVQRDAALLWHEGCVVDLLGDCCVRDRHDAIWLRPRRVWFVPISLKQTTSSNKG